MEQQSCVAKNEEEIKRIQGASILNKHVVCSIYNNKNQGISMICLFFRPFYIFKMYVLFNLFSEIIQ
jgi:hypothetical protein